MLGRPIDTDHPIQDLDPARLTLTDQPAATIEPPD
jgi:hypothetical protein